LSEKHFSIFAEMTGDAHPLHYDAAYARANGWEAPLAHGLMLLGLCAFGAAPISEEVTESMIAMLGNDVRYKRPAFAGDTVTPQFTVLRSRPRTPAVASSGWGSRSSISATNWSSKARTS
jgi:3-hydroxybutyryl-CoA dehydratase